MTAQYGITCPHCEQENVTGAKKYGFMIGLLLFCRYGSKTEIGCTSCLQSKGIQAALITFVVGWWCFPWGIGTPFIVLYNFIQAFLVQPSTKLADEILVAAGISPESVHIDSSGHTREQSLFLMALLQVLEESIWSDGHADEREITTAVKIANDFFEGSLAGAEVERRIRSRQCNPNFTFDHLNADLRILLWRVAVQIVFADDRIYDQEKSYLRRLAGRLGLPSHMLLEFESFFAGGAESTRGESRTKRAQALNLLGLPATATPIEIRRAYRRLVLEHHPDTVAGDAKLEAEAHDRMQALNAAYATAMGPG